MTNENAGKGVTSTDDRAAMRARLIAAGLDPGEVAATLRGPRNLSVADALPDAMTALRRETRSHKTWGTVLADPGGRSSRRLPLPVPGMLDRTVRLRGRRERAQCVMPTAARRAGPRLRRPQRRRGPAGCHRLEAGPHHRRHLVGGAARLETHCETKASIAFVHRASGVRRSIA